MCFLEYLNKMFWGKRDKLLLREKYLYVKMCLEEIFKGSLRASPNYHLLQPIVKPFVSHSVHPNMLCVIVER